MTPRCLCSTAAGVRVQDANDSLASTETLSGANVIILIYKRVFIAAPLAPLKVLDAGL